MKIEVGKTYRDREGSTWFLCKYTGIGDRPFVAIREDGIHERFTLQGTPFLFDESYWDFVEEVKDKS